MSDYDDLEESDVEDQVIFDHDAYAAVQRLHARWKGGPAIPPPSIGRKFALTGRYQFAMRLSDLTDAIIALKLKKKSLPLRFELLPNCLRISVASDANLFLQVDAPLISGPMVADICFERDQDLMLQLITIRNSCNPSTEIECELNLSQLKWEIKLPYESSGDSSRTRKRGRRDRPTLRIGISVPEVQIRKPWEGEALGEGRPTDAAALARALGCAHHLMRRRIVDGWPSGIDVARGRALAGCSEHFYHVTHPCLEGLAFRVAPTDSARLQRALTRMCTGAARCYAGSTAQIISDGVLTCAVPHPTTPFPALERMLEDLDYEEVVLLQDQTNPFFKPVSVFLPNPDGLVRAELHGNLGALRVRFVTEMPRSRMWGWSALAAPLKSSAAALPGRRAQDPPKETDAIVKLDEPRLAEAIRQEITINAEAAYRALMALPSGDVHLRFSTSRALLVHHEVGGMRATAFFANRGPLASGQPG